MSDDDKHVHAADGHDAVGGGELRQAVAQRQKVKATLGALEEENRRLEERIEDLEAAPRFTLEAAEQAKKALLAEAAGQAGACSGRQVAAMLAERFILEQADSGQLSLSCVGDDGEVAKDENGEVLRDPLPAIRSFLARPGNENLILPDRRAQFQRRRETREAIERQLANPPRTVQELARLSPEVRQAVLDRLSPQQRAALVERAGRNWL